MLDFFQQIIFGISVGSIYALIALALTLVYRSMNLINFAQGELFMVGAFVGFQLYAHFHVPLLLSFPLTLIITFLLGGVIERIFLRPLETNKNELSLLVMTIALFIILPSLTLLTFGPDVHVLPPFSDHQFVLGGLQISAQYLIVIVATVLVMLALYLLFNKTTLGLALRAVAQDPFAARVVGIDVSRANSFTFSLASMLGGFAGFLYAPLIVVTFDMGGPVMLKGFTAAVLGGLGLASGAVLGGFALGVIEQFSTLFVSSAYKDMISFGLLLLIILLRPNGILGKKSITKV